MHFAFTGLVSENAWSKRTQKNALVMPIRVDLVHRVEENAYFFGLGGVYRCCSPLGALSEQSVELPKTTLNDNIDNTGNSDPIVVIKDLNFKRDERVILEDISLNIPRGKITAIMGPSGCGKTTLLELIGGQLNPDGGTVVVDGQEVPALSRRSLFALRKRMGRLFQHGALLTDLSVFDNVAFPIREHTRLPEPIIRNLVLMKLEAVGLRGARDLMPSQLSGGMARRVALARAIALDPAIVMYDEPFAGQDPISMGVLVRLIKQINDALGITSIVVSHDVPETASIADCIYVLSNKKIVGSGSPEAIRQTGSAWVQQFMNALPDGPVQFHYEAPSVMHDLLEGGK